MTEFEELLKKAQECGVKISASRSGTRAHAIAVTHLETAQLWAKQDREEKERIERIQKGEG